MELNRGGKIIFLKAFVIILAVILLTFFFYSTSDSFLTGRVSLDLEIENAGEFIDGLVIFNLREGELIPLDDTIVRINLNDQVNEVSLSELVSSNANGRFYVEGQEISGRGEGYGFIGEKRDYTDVFFTLLIKEAIVEDESKSVDLAEDSADSFDSNMRGNTFESDSIDSFSGNSGNSFDSDDGVEGFESDSGDLLEDQDSGNSAANDDDSSDSFAPSLSPEEKFGLKIYLNSLFKNGLIVGRAIDGGVSEQIIGVASKNKPFRVNVGEREVSLKSGSVFSDGKQISDGFVNLERRGVSVIASTDYYISVDKGFGRNYLTENVNKLGISLKDFGIVAEEGTLEVDLIHNSKVISSFSKVLRDCSDSDYRLSSDAVGVCFNGPEDSCGDGVTDLTQEEECDDSNLISGDGCSSFCKEEKYFCDGSICIYAGSDQELVIEGDSVTTMLGATVQGGDVTDLKISWRVEEKSEDSQVTFVDPNFADSVVTFDSSGRYVLTSSVSDGENYHEDSLVVTVKDSECILNSQDEICDNLDNDCNGIIDDGCDDDSDGWCDAFLNFGNDSLEDSFISSLVSDKIVVENFFDSSLQNSEFSVDGRGLVCSLGGGDCNDENSLVNPGASEICDGVDNDCDGGIDEECSLPSFPYEGLYSEIKTRDGLLLAPSDVEIDADRNIVGSSSPSDLIPGASSGYIILLRDLSLSEFEGGLGLVEDGQRDSLRKNHFASLQETHQDVRELVSGRVSYEFYNSVNAIVVSDLSSQDRNILEEDPRVLGIVKDKIVNANLVDAVPYLFTNVAWRYDVDLNQCQNTGKTCLRGNGTTVAVLDTGLDSANPFFSDSNIVMVYDFANNDADPRDDNGHGTFVAGIISGKDDTDNDNIWDVGEYWGIAPDSELHVIKVLNKYGSGSFSTVIAGIEKVMDPNGDLNYDDHLDVLSLSLGAYCPDGYNGECGPEDVLAKAVDSAVSVGVVAVVAAGNSGDGEETIETPGVSPKAITVGAVFNNDFMATISQVQVPLGNTLESKPTGIVTAGGNREVLQLVDGGRGLPADFDGIDCNGKTALIDMVIPGEMIGWFSYENKMYNAYNAGCRAVLFWNSQNIIETNFFFDFVTIPSFIISEEDGLEIKQALARGDRIFGSFRAWHEGNLVPEFSSRGPTTTSLKPDVVTPGVGICSSQFDGYFVNRNCSSGQQVEGFVSLYGTSASAPMVSGAAALILQRTPSYTPSQVKSALMGTSSKTANPDNRLITEGFGMINIAQAVAKNNVPETVINTRGKFNASTQSYDITGTAEGSYTLYVSSTRDITKGSYGAQVCTGQNVVNGVLCQLNINNFEDKDYYLTLVSVNSGTSGFDTSVIHPVFGYVSYPDWRYDSFSYIREEGLGGVKEIFPTWWGIVDVNGTATAPDFSSYRITFKDKDGRDFSSRLALTNGGRSRVEDNVLAELNLTDLESNYYDLNLTVDRTSGNDISVYRRFYVDAEIKVGYPVKLDFAYIDENPNSAIFYSLVEMPTITDVERDGLKEISIALDRNIALLDDMGREKEGWPYFIPEYDNGRIVEECWTQAGTSSFDLDKDNKEEIFFTDKCGITHVLDEDGTDKFDEWAFHNEGDFLPKAASDIDDDGVYDLIVSQASGHLSVKDMNQNEVFNATISEQGKWGFFLRTPFAYDFDNDNFKEIVVLMSSCSGQSCSTNEGTSLLYVLDSEGEILNGWPKEFSQIESDVLVQDINGDNKREIIFAGDGGKIYVLNGDGSSLPGWEGGLDFSSYLRRYEEQGYIGSLTVADVDGNNVVDFVVTSERPDMLFVFDSQSKELLFDPIERKEPNYPCYITGSAFVGQLDLDPQMEIITSGYTAYVPDEKQTNAICAYNHDGTLVEGFPKPSGFPVTLDGIPIFDIDNDGDNEIALLNELGQMLVWDLDTYQGGFPSVEDGVEWGEHRYDSIHSSCYNCNLQCSDGIDNDGDNLIDFPEDPGCFTEFDVAEETLACANGVDDDNDNLIDVDDPGCYTLGKYTVNDDSEDNTPIHCSDGIDNDGDNLTDSDDPGCYTYEGYKIYDEDEIDSLPVCSDYFDNDEDGWIDFPEDPGCYYEQSRSEYNALVFVSERDYRGYEIGGVDQANSKCQSLADMAGLEGRWVALFGDSESTIFETLHESDGPFATTDGKRVGYLWEMGYSLRGNYPINVTEKATPKKHNALILNESSGLYTNLSLVWTGLSENFARPFVCEYGVFPQTACTDGLDNDNDGRVDGNDRECFSERDISEYSSQNENACTIIGGTCSDSCGQGKSPYPGGNEGCVNQICCFSNETKCTDYIDNDYDGLTDCEDSDCALTEACQNYIMPDTSINGCFCKDDWTGRANAGAYTGVVGVADSTDENWIAIDWSDYGKSYNRLHESGYECAEARFSIGGPGGGGDGGESSLDPLTLNDDPVAPGTPTPLQPTARKAALYCIQVELQNRPPCFNEVDDDDDGFIDNADPGCTGGEVEYGEYHTRVFVSRDKFSPDFGGLEGADQVCTQIANDAQLGGEWIAWLSSGNFQEIFYQDAYERIFDYYDVFKPVTRLDAEYLAKYPSDLRRNDSMGNYIDSPIIYDEYGDDVNSEDKVWTFTTKQGRSFEFNFCEGQPDGVRCDNGMFCDGIDECQSGQCVNVGEPVVCDDGVSCTYDYCDNFARSCNNVEYSYMCPEQGQSCAPQYFPNEPTGCGYLGNCQEGDDPSECETSCADVPDGFACSDQSFCNGVDECQSGQCVNVGEPVVCDDGVSCTENHCVDNVNRLGGQCEFKINDGLCASGEICLPDHYSGGSGCGPDSADVSDCSLWTEGSRGRTLVGKVGATTEEWTSFEIAKCEEENHLICLELPRWNFG